MQPYGNFVPGGPPPPPIPTFAPPVVPEFISAYQPPPGAIPVMPGYVLLPEHQVPHHHPFHHQAAAFVAPGSATPYAVPHHQPHHYGYAPPLPPPQPSIFAGPFAPHSFIALTAVGYPQSPAHTGIGPVSAGVLPDPRAPKRRATVPKDYDQPTELFPTVCPHFAAGRCNRRRCRFQHGAGKGDHDSDTGGGSAGPVRDS